MFESNIRIGRFHADCGSSSEEIVDTVEKHYGLFYIRANRCTTPYDDIVALRGWKIGEIGGTSVKLNSILTEITEYILIGTLASFSVAAFIGFAARLML